MPLRRVFAVVAPASETRTFFECTALTVAIAGAIDADAEDDGDAQSSDIDMDLASARDGTFYSDDACSDESDTVTLEAGEVSAVHYYKNLDIAEDTITVSTSGLDDAEASLTTNSPYNGTWSTSNCLEDPTSPGTYVKYTVEISNDEGVLTNYDYAGDSTCATEDFQSVVTFDISYGDVIDEDTATRKIDFALAGFSFTPKAANAVTNWGGVCPGTTFTVGTTTNLLNDANCTSGGIINVTEGSESINLWAVDGETLNRGVVSGASNTTAFAASTEAARPTTVSTIPVASFTLQD